MVVLMIRCDMTMIWSSKPSTISLVSLLQLYPEGKAQVLKISPLPQIQRDAYFDFVREY